MDYNFFAYMARMKQIMRWGLMRNTQTENIQEHSHAVAVIAHALAVIGNELFGGRIDAGAVAAAALFHDASEILTGDLPTPIKYFNPEIREAYQAIEEISAARLLDMLPENLRRAYEDVLNAERHQPEVWRLVKAADKIAAYIKCAEELRAGNTEFKRAAEQTLAAINDNPLPEVGYFTEHFLPAYLKSLDELS